ncbi:G-protein coupled receptors family 3 profile domain-containing protein [Plasmodiophora brassicae]
MTTIRPALFVSLLFAPLASAFQNLSQCAICDGSNAGNVVIQISPDGSVLTALPTPATSDEQFVMIMNLLKTQSPTAAVLYMDVIWAGDMAGYLSDLGTLLTPQQLDAPIPFEQDYATVKGVRVGAPYFIDTGFLYYRKDLLAKYGYSGPPTTWDEMEAMAATIQAGEQAHNPNFWGYVWPGAATEGLSCILLEVFATHGAGTIVEEDGTVSLNNPLGLAALTRMVNWIGTISPPSVTSMNNPTSLAAFTAGNAAFHRDWPGALSTIKGTFVEHVTGITLVPSNGGSTRHHGTLGGWMVGVNKHAVAQARAGQLVAELISDAHQIAEFYSHTKMPVSRDIYMGQGLCAPSNPNVTQICDVGTIPSDYLVARWSKVASPNYQATSAMVYSAVNKALLGAVSPSETLALLECQITLRLHGEGALPMQCLTEIAISTWALTTNLVLTAIALVVVTAAAVGIAVHRNHPVMKAAAPLFCLTICIGGIVLLVSNIAAGLHPARYPGACWATAWLTCIGFMVMMGALFVKHWRVGQIFQQVKSGRAMGVVKITNGDVAKRVALLVALDVVVIGIWMGAQGSSPSYARVMQASTCPCQNADLHQFVTACTLNAGGLWTVVVLHGIVVVWGTVMAIHTRSIPMLLFNESKFMGLTTYNIALIMVLTVPVMVIAEANPSMQLMVRSVACVLVVTLTIVVLFGYKFYLIFSMTPDQITSLTKRTVMDAGTAGKGDDPDVAGVSVAASGRPTAAGTTRPNNHL